MIQTRDLTVNVLAFCTYLPENGDDRSAIEREERVSFLMDRDDTYVDSFQEWTGEYLETVYQIPESIIRDNASYEVDIPAGYVLADLDVIDYSIS